MQSAGLGPRSLFECQLALREEADFADGVPASPQGSGTRTSHITRQAAIWEIWYLEHTELSRQG